MKTRVRFCVTALLIGAVSSFAQQDPMLEDEESFAMENEQVSEPETVTDEDLTSEAETMLEDEELATEEETISEQEPMTDEDLTFESETMLENEEPDEEFMPEPESAPEEDLLPPEEEPLPEEGNLQY